MPIEQIANALKFLAFYTASGVGKTGLTVTVDVFKNDTLIATAASATEIGDGLYRYTLASGSNDAEGEYIAVFKTADSTVDGQHIVSAWTVQKAGVENLNATISSRAIGGSTATLVSPVAQGGNATIQQGKDYSPAINTALQWTLTNPPLVTPTSVTFTSVALGFNKACDYTSPTITLTLTAVETALFHIGAYAFNIEAVIGGLNHPGLVSGSLTVEGDV